MKNRNTGKIAAALLVATMAVAAPYAGAADKPSNQNQQAVKAAVNAQGKSARAFIGQDVVDRSGNRLGELNDIVVNTKTGKAVLATIGSGGVLGVGERVRAVPFSKLSQRADNELQLDVDNAKWSSAPQLNREELSALNDQRGREIFNHYGAEWKKDMAGGNALAFATHLSGKDLMNGSEEVGDVEDVIVNMNNQRASLLIDPNDNFTGSNEKFVVSLNKVSGFGQGREELMTQLSRNDFERATPADRGYWDTAPDTYVYRWSAWVYPYAAPVAATTPGGQMRRGINDQKDSVAMIKEALRNDTSLQRAADKVEVRKEGDQVILTGTVPSRDMKDKIEDKAEKLSQGLDVENRLRIATGE